MRDRGRREVVLLLRDRSRVRIRGKEIERERGVLKSRGC